MSEEYISPEELAKRGFTVRDNQVYRLTLIERYFEKGWLEFGDHRLTPEIRLEAADRLAADFYFSRFPQNSAIDWQKERVDGGLNKCEPTAVLDARDRFFKAIKAIPSEFWPVVQDVVLYETRPDIGGATKAMYNELLAVFKRDLCRGLDRLALHYGVRIVRHKILATRTEAQPATPNQRRYTIEVKGKRNGV